VRDKEEEVDKGKGWKRGRGKGGEEYIKITATGVCTNAMRNALLINECFRLRLASRDR
jgi:hypothetical protein